MELENVERLRTGMLLTCFDPARIPDVVDPVVLLVNAILYCVHSGSREICLKMCFYKVN